MQIEEMSIALANPSMCVYVLKGGQRVYECQVVNVAQGIVTFVTNLPRLGGDISVLIVRKEGAEEGTQKGFVAKKAKEEVAVQWLCSGWRIPTPFMEATLWRHPFR